MIAARAAPAGLFALVAGSCFALGGTTAIALGGGSSLVLLAAGIALLRAGRSEALDPFHLLLLLAAAVPAAHLLLPGPLAAPPFEARVEAHRIVSLCALAALSFEIARRRGRAFLLEPAALAVGLVCLFGLAQRLFGPQAFLLGEVPENARPFGPFLNRNHFAGLAAAALPLAFASEEPGTRARRSALAAVCLLGALVPGSRTGALALAAALLATLLVRPIPRSGRQETAALLLVGAAAAALPGGVLDRALGSSAGSRFPIWRDAVHLAARSPVLGHGPASFLDAFPSVQTFPSPYVISHAESDLVQSVFETGIAATLPLLLAFGLALRRCARGASREASACFASLAAIGVASLLDTPWRGYGFGAFGAVVLGCAAAPARREA
ncbi:MAG: O-antigen ligase family protein [Planctomycetes bacterium]|nr:O-antigen ligase family protein [Planctomycetota bacterium]